MNKKIRSLVIVAWIGSLWCIGLLVAPLLFSTLPRITAAMVAGRGFEVMAWVGIVSAVILFLSYLLEYGGKAFKYLPCHLVWLMLLCVLVNYVAITPVIEELKRHINENNAGSLGQEFGLWHAASSIIYYIQCVLGGFLVWREARR